MTDNKCLICKDSIKDPVCFSCLESEIESWLLGKMPEVVSNVRRQSINMSFYSADGSPCVICGNKMSICSSCYSDEIHNVLEPHPELANEFISFFDLELRQV